MGASSSFGLPIREEKLAPMGRSYGQSGQSQFGYSGAAGKAPICAAGRPSR